MPTDCTCTAYNPCPLHDRDEPEGFYFTVDSLTAAIRDAVHQSKLVPLDLIIVDPYRENAAAIIKAAKEAER